MEFEDEKMTEEEFEDEEAQIKDEEDEELKENERTRRQGAPTPIQDGE